MSPRQCDNGGFYDHNDCNNSNWRVVGWQNRSDIDVDKFHCGSVMDGGYSRRAMVHR